MGGYLEAQQQRWHDVLHGPGPDVLEEGVEALGGERAHLLRPVTQRRLEEKKERGGGGVEVRERV